MIRINLLPVRAEKKKEVVRNQALAAGGVALVLAVVVAAVHLTLGSHISETQAELSRTRAEITRLQVVIGEVKEFKKKKRDLEEKIEVISQLEERQRGPVRVLHELARVIPDQIWIERLKDSGGALSLEGVAIDNQTIARFMTDLEASPWFQGVRLEVTRQVNRGDVALKSFSIQASVAYPKGG